MRHATAILIVTAILGSSAAALGDSEHEVHPVAQKTAHYGWQTLLVDSAGFGVIAIAVATEEGLDSRGRCQTGQAARRESRPASLVNLPGVAN